MFWRYVLLFVGIFAASTAAIFIKASHLPAVFLAGSRLLLAAVVLSPLFFHSWRKHRGTYTRQHLRRTFFPALLLATHIISWGFGARMTYSAQASLIVNLAPAALPFFLFPLTGERINGREIFGTALALLGVGILSAKDALNGDGNIWGNVVCFVSMLFFAWYIAFGRRNRDFPSLWLYVVPIYFQAGLLSFFVLIFLPHVNLPPLDRRELTLLAALVFIPTILGHSLLNASVRHLRGQIVSLCNVSQFVFATVMAFFLFHETPSTTFYFSSLVVVAGIALVVFSAPSAQPKIR